MEPGAAVPRTIGDLAPSAPLKFERMGFEGALAALRAGQRVYREGWRNRDAVFLYLVPGSTFEVNRAPLLGIYPEGTSIRYQPHIDVRTALGTCVPWCPDQTDVLADDWFVRWD
jgi:hypothetical protein